MLNIAEVNGDVTVTGSVLGAQTGDMVTLTVNSVEYSGLVRPDGTFSINVRGSDLLADQQADGVGEVQASITTYDSAGNPGSWNTVIGYDVDIQRPTASIAVDDTSLNIGDDALVTITFNEPVTDFSNADLTVSNGTLTPVSSSDGGVTWTATFTPDAPIVDPGSIITLDNSEVFDVASNSGLATTNSAPIAIDTIAPEVTGVSVDDLKLTDAYVGNTLTLTVDFSEVMDTSVTPTLVFSEDVFNALNPSLQVSNESWDASGQTLTVTYDILDVGVDFDAITVDVIGAQDAAGNTNVDYAPVMEFSIDTLNPTVSITNDNSDGVVSSEDMTVTYTLNFSEAVESIAPSDLTITGGALVSGPVLSENGLSATLSIIADDFSNADLVLTINDTVVDLNGNVLALVSNTDTLPVDTLNPRVTISEDNIDGVVSDPDNVVLYTLEFDRPVVDVTADDLTITGGVLTGGPSLDPEGMTATFEVTATDNSTQDLTVTVNDTVVDAAGRPVVPATNTLTVDTANPTAIITDDSDGLVSDADNLVNYTVTFDSPVQAVTSDDLSVNGGVLTDGPFLAANRLSATFSVTANDGSTADLVVTVNDTVLDDNGNALIEESSSLSVDTVNPIAKANVSINYITDSRVGSVMFVFIEFDEAMDPSIVPDVTFSEDIAGTLELSSMGWYNSNTKLTLVYSINDTNVDISNIGVNISGGLDIDGNYLQDQYAITTFNIDTLNPNVTFEDDSGGHVTDVNSIVNYTLTFSEPVMSLEAADLTISGGTLTSGPVLSGNGLTATLTITADNESTAPLVLSVGSNVVDSHGNALDANSSELTVDTVDYEPYFECNLYTASELKVTGATDAPIGSYVVGATPGEHDLASSPAGQAAQDTVYGTSIGETIDHNTAFSNDAGQWAKNLHVDFFVYDVLTSIEIVVDPQVFDPVLGVPGFDLAASGLMQTGANTWEITDPTQFAALLASGLDLSVLYDVTDTGGPLDFNLVVNVSGTDGGVPYDLTQTLDFSWREATSEADFDLINGAGEQVMVLPRDGIGVEINAGGGDDFVYAGAGDDLLVGGAGGDTLDGGTGNDTASYEGSTADITASLVTGLGSGGDAEGDTFVSIENLIGGNGNDILIGNADANILDGGELGIDTASYEDSIIGVAA